VEPKPVSPQFVKFTEKVASVMPWMGLSLGLGLIGISIWGFWACRAIARSYAVPGFGPNPAVAALSWLVLFLPIALVGAYLVRWVLKQMQMAAAEKRIRAMAEARVEILPPPSIYQGSHVAPGVPVATHVPQPVHREPLDEATTRRLDELGERAAKIVNVGAGLFFLISGLLGFLVMWIDSHQTVYHGLRQFRSQTQLLLGCGFFTFIGAIILLRSSRKPDTAWLAPLQAFTKIISVRAAAEEMKRKRGERPRLGPGSSP
jgi:hypothetical protein